MCGPRELVAPGLPGGHTVPARASVAVPEAVAFLRAQAAWLAGGLRHGDDRRAAAVVLAAHDRSHPCWVALIAATRRRFDADLAERLAGVYRAHGCAAGTLARGDDHGLAPAVAAAARRVRAEELRRITDEAVGALLAASAGG